jgi:hypothetical protein
LSCSWLASHPGPAKSRNEFIGPVHGPVQSPGFARVDILLRILDPPLYSCNTTNWHRSVANFGAGKHLNIYYNSPPSSSLSWKSLALPVSTVTAVSTASVHMRRIIAMNSRHRHHTSVQFFCTCRYNIFLQPQEVMSSKLIGTVDTVHCTHCGHVDTAGSVEGEVG